MKTAICLFLAVAAVVAQPQPRPNAAQAGQPDPSRRRQGDQTGRTEASATAVLPPGAVEGRAVSATTGEPLRKVNITLRPAGRGAGSYAATTEADGGFKFTAVDPGRYTLIGEKTGFVRQTYGARVAGSAASVIEVTSGQTVTSLGLKLTPQGVVAGRVADDEGDPLQGVNVQVMRYSYPRGKRQLIGFQNSSTNDQGEFRIANLPPGRYYLSAVRNRQGPPAARAAAAEETGYVTTYFPQAIDIGGASPIDITPGSELRGIDIRMMKARLFRIKGVVAGMAAASPDAGGRRGPGLMLSLTSRQGGGRGMAMVNRADGTFEFAGVLPGSYTIVAQSMGPGQQRMTARVPIDVASANVENVAVQLMPGIELAGVVRIDDPQATAKPSAVRLNFVSAEGGGPGGFGGGGGNGQVQDNGAFLARLAAEKYNLEISGIPEGYFLKAVKLSGRDVADTGFDLSMGAGPVEIVLAPGAVDITGRVETASGDAAGSVLVTAVPESGSSRRDLHKSASSDATGNFTLRGLAPGDYKVFAWEEIEPNAWMDREFRQPFESAAATAKAASSGAASVSLKVIGREAVEREAAKIK